MLLTEEEVNTRTKLNDIHSPRDEEEEEEVLHALIDASREELT